jgi:hypothetical protein
MNQWYIYKDDEVQGPFTAEELEGQISRTTQVCPAGSEDWIKAEDVEELQQLFSGKKPTAPQKPKKTSANNTKQKKNRQDPGQENNPPVLPTLKSLHLITRQASDDDLKRELEEFWEEYDRSEQRIIRNEMTNRGIWPEKEESEEQSVL